MSDQEDKKKRWYQPPKAFSMEAQAAETGGEEGNCTPGSAIGKCFTGGTAIGRCQPGSTAHGTCNVGSVALGDCDVGSAAARCVAGSNIR